MTYTQEQIEEAKNVLNVRARMYLNCESDKYILTILAALEAAEKERDDWCKRYREAGELAELNRLERCHAEQDRDDERRMTDKAMEQYDRELEKNYNLEAYAAKLEKAGDGMRKSNKVEHLYAWDAARKEKPCFLNPMLLDSVSEYCGCI